jgi:hypothetical protein
MRSSIGHAGQMYVDSGRPESLVAWALAERVRHNPHVRSTYIAAITDGMSAAAAASMSEPTPPRPATDRRRLLDKLLRELVRSEVQTTEHPHREARRIGESPPVTALRDVAVHALAMRPRLTLALEGHGVVAGRGGIGATLSTLRHIVSDRIHDTERSYRAALLDLRHGVDVVRVLREVARLEELFGLIRWCDDWLTARRTLVARVEAQLGWFADQPIQRAVLESVEDVQHERP